MSSRHREAVKQMVPRQFVGQARLLLQRMQAEEDAHMEAVKPSLGDLFNRLIRHPERRLREGQFRALATAWKAAPQRYRLQFCASVEPRGRWGTVTEVRVGSTKVHKLAWEPGNFEHGACLHSLDLALPSKRLTAPTLRYTPVCHVGLHALARRYERGGDAPDAVLVAEMRLMAQGFLGACKEADARDTLQIDTKGGRWSGDFANMEYPDTDDVDLVFFVRTFLD